MNWTALGACACGFILGWSFAGEFRRGRHERRRLTDAELAAAIERADITPMSFGFRDYPPPPPPTAPPDTEKRA